MKELKSSPAHTHRKPNEPQDGNRGRPRHRKFSPKGKTPMGLPPASTLQAYEALSEGAAEQLLEMAEIEQEHRHEWEDNYLRSYTKSHRIGLLFGFVVAIAVVSGSVALSFAGDSLAAVALAASGFFCLAVNSIVASRTRHFRRKPPIHTVQKKD